MTISRREAALFAFGGALAASGVAAAQTPTLRRHTVEREGTFGGERVRYQVIAEETTLNGGGAAAAGVVTSYTYLRQGVADTSRRPVIFVWNGGPGSSSVWMHLGLFGPRRVRMEDPVHPPTTAPFTLEDNPHSFLDIADVVMFDPIGTGYSKLLPGADATQFYGNEQDARATAEFISKWLIANDRWNSPKYVVGESYGATRAALVSRVLMGGRFNPAGSLGALTLNGVVLLGQAIGGADGELEYASLIPCLAALAHYHQKAHRGRRADQVVIAAKTFARDAYLPAIYAGDRLSTLERARVRQMLSQTIGLSEAYLDQNDLRVGASAFRSELLRDRGLTLGAYDGRYTLPSDSEPQPPDPVGDDPAMGQYTPAFAAGLDLYLREIGAARSERYELIAFRDVNFAWGRGPANPGMPPMPGAAQSLSAAMRANPALRLFVGTGYYDLVTHIGDADYMAAHSNLPLDRVTTGEYPSGHMPYLGDDSARALGADLRRFFSAA